MASHSWRHTLKFAATRVFPIGFCVGAAIETCMFYLNIGGTTFWGVAIRKEAERRRERAAAAAAAGGASSPPQRPGEA